MPAFEITRIVRSAGFEPLAPPLREGTTYVLRATDFRGILVRVVVDARSGAIRAVNRIVPGPAPYGQAGMVSPPYGVAPYGQPGIVTPPYGVAPAYPPPDIAGPEMVPEEETTTAPAPPAPLAPPLPAAALRPGAHPLASGPPLPRPRPPEFASRQAADDAKSGAKSGAKPEAKSEAKSEAKPEAKSDARPGMMPAGKADIKSGTAVSGPAAAPVAPNKSAPAPVPIND